MGETRSATPPSRFAYLLLTHTRPDRVEDLASRILALSSRANIVVHHDQLSEDISRLSVGRPESTSGECRTLGAT